MRDPAVFRPPFVTEVDEPVHDDCVVASGLMLVSDWTLGQVTDAPRGPVQTKRQLKRTREGMRDHLSGDKQRGGLTPADLVEMVRETWPSLPTLRTPLWTWDELWDSLSHGRRVALWGNPADVRKPASPLRRWTHDDDFGHCIRVGPSRQRAGRSEAWVMDPLGEGRYKGQWVGRAQLRQFAFLDGEQVRSLAVVVVGGERL